MHTIILSSDLRQAEFIKHGLKYENLNSEVVSLNFENEINENLLFCDGIFLHLENNVDIEQIFNQCKSITNDVPIFLLTTNDNLAVSQILLSNEEVLSFSRPYIFSSIASEMRIAIFQNKENVERRKFVYKNIELDVINHTVFINDSEIYLRNKEFALLLFLMANPGKVLSRTTILENVWDRNTNIFTNTVDVHISQLRKKIEKFVKEKYIHTIPCNGYILG